MSFSIVVLLCIWAVVWCALKIISQQVRYEFESVHLRPMPRDENVAKRLNAIWNRDPRNWRDDPTGYKKCMIFLHAFDFQNGENTEGIEWDGACRVYSDCPWCPRVRVPAHKLPFPYPLLHFIGVSHAPSSSLSFSAFNRHITRDGQIMFGNVGFVFDFENTADESISPLCYYPIDGYSTARANSGCGPIGVQWSPTPFISQGYTMHGSDASAGLDELYGDEDSYTKAALDRPIVSNTISQPSLNFKQFVELSLHLANAEKTDNMGHNEVIIQNWVNVNFDAVPLSAFYFLEGDEESREHASRIADACLLHTGRRIPVVSFNPRPEDHRTAFRMTEMSNDATAIYSE